MTAHAPCACAGAFALPPFAGARCSRQRPRMRGPRRDRTGEAPHAGPPRHEKGGLVAEMTERFQTSAGAVLTEYRGLSAAQLGELRRSLDGNPPVAVVKN